MSMTKLQMQLKKKQKEAKAAAGKGTKQSADGKKKMAADQAAIQCKICLQTFPSTSKQQPPALQIHVHHESGRLVPAATYDEV